MAISVTTQHATPDSPTHADPPDSATTPAALHFAVAYSPADPAWDAFLARTRGGSYVQSSLWARSKALQGWRAIRVIAADSDGRIVGGAQMLLRALPVGGAVAFIYKGPVATDAAIGAAILSEVHRVAQRMRVRYLTVQPPEGGEPLAPRLLSHGYRRTPAGWGQAPATTAVDLTQDLEQITKRMRKSARTKLHRAEHLGVSVRAGTETDVSVFHRLLVSTSQRQHFLTHSEEFYLHFWQLFAPPGHLMVFVAEYAGEPVSALLAICFGDTVTYWRGAWSGLHGDAQPNMMLHHEVIKWAKAQGYARYDFLGLDSDHTLSWALATGQITRESLGATPSFKLGFGGDIHTSPVAYEYVPNPILRRIYGFARDHQAVWRLVNAAASRARGVAHRG